MGLQGKGFYIWKVPYCEGGNVEKITAVAKASGCTHLLIKIANGTLGYNIDSKNGEDHAIRLVNALHQEGIQAWGWHYVYGDNPIGEANIAISRIAQTGVDGYVIDAEVEYESSGRREAARRFMSQLRSRLSSFPVALSSFRYPSYHPQLPWKEFLEKCDFNMPQVYWMQAHNAGIQLKQCLRQFQALTPYRPIIPTGAAFAEHGWKPTAAEVLDFMNTAKELNLPAVNFWEWAATRGTSVPGLWDTIASYSWDGAPEDITEKYIDALNSHDPKAVSSLYSPIAIRVTAQKTIQGVQAIQSWYQGFFSQTLPGGSFKLSGYTGSGVHRHLHWTAASPAGKILNGSDTLGILNGKIAYHYSYYSITP